MEIGGLELEWLGHAGFLIKNSKIIYIDPYKIHGGLPKADLILITHSHYDHCSLADLNKIVKEGTRIVYTPDSQSKVARLEIPIRMEIIEEGQELDMGNIKIIAVPAYNINKSFHPKDQGFVGYLIKINDVIIYHSGDTDLIPEMQRLTGYNQQDKKLIALLPIGGRYTMTPEEAAEAAKIIKPSLAIPMHWGSIIGNREDAEEFKEFCKSEGINCKILDKI